MTEAFEAKKSKTKKRKGSQSEFSRGVEESVVCHSRRPRVCLSLNDDQGACVILSSFQTVACVSVMFHMSGV